MSTALQINGDPITYEAEANAGVSLSTGSRWWGTLIKWRRGTSGKWNRITIMDVHPFDTEAIEAGLCEYVKGIARP